MKFHVLLLFASTVRLQNTLKGFRFEDNKSKYRWEDGKNGMAQLNFDFFLPTRVAEVAGFRRTKKMPSILSSVAYLLIRDQKMFFFAYLQFCLYLAFNAQ